MIRLIKSLDFLRSFFKKNIKKTIIFVMSKKNKNCFFTKHLKDINESYFTHFCHAFYFCVNCVISSFTLLVHCLMPFFFVANGSSIIKKLYKIMSIRTQVADLTNNKDKHIAIVGFGASGLLTFFNLVKNYQPSSNKLIIKVFEKNHNLPKGIAYSTKNFNHLLNVPVCKMGICEEDREHFLKWLNKKGYKYQKNDFVPRQIFGIYLEDILSESLKIADKKQISYEFITKEVSEIIMKNKNYIIDGNVYNYCVLATGVQLRNSSNNFWNIDVESYLNDKEIHILGCGLTAFDLIISLKDLNYSGQIFLHSRTNKKPQKHKISEIINKIESPLNLEDSLLPLSQIFRKFTKSCKKSDNWRDVFDSIRPITQKFWQNLSQEKKKRFMRHCFRMWNIHRHRCPELQYKIIEELMNYGRLLFLQKPIESNRFIDCSGFDYCPESELISSLIKNQIIEKDELELGIVSRCNNFYLIAGLNFGSMFEITAIPDITLQAKETAQKILEPNLF